MLHTLNIFALSNIVILYLKFLYQHIQFLRHYLYIFLEMSIAFNPLFFILYF